MKRSDFRKLLNEVARKFDRHSKTFADTAWELQDRLKDIRIQPQAILEVGCRTGLLCSQLESQMPDALLIAVDESKNMISIAHQKTQGVNTHFAIADCDALPFSSKSVDLILSNLAPTFYAPEDFFTECYRLLNYDGVLMFSMLGLGTFKELNIRYNFYDMHTIGDLLISTGFTESVVDAEKYSCEFRDQRSLRSELKHSGMLFDLKNDVLAEVTNDKKTKSDAEQEKLKLSIEMIYGLAWRKDHNIGSSMNIPFSPIP